MHRDCGVIIIMLCINCGVVVVMAFANEEDVLCEIHWYKHRIIHIRLQTYQVLVISLFVAIVGVDFRPLIEDDSSTHCKSRCFLLLTDDETATSPAFDLRLLLLFSLLSSFS
jgi:hypothetical protein